jgi:hypothetical protein
MSNYDVGYGKPPKQGQFQKGRSGNPQGRPRGTKNFKTDLHEELAEPVQVRENGALKTVSSQRAVVIRLREKALKGDQRALNKLIDLAERHDLEDTADETEKEFAKEDRAIIERFLERSILEKEAQEAANQESADEDEVQ